MWFLLSDTVLLDIHHDDTCVSVMFPFVVENIHNLILQVCLFFPWWHHYFFDSSIKLYKFLNECSQTPELDCWHCRFPEAIVFPSVDSCAAISWLLIVFILRFKELIPYSKVHTQTHERETERGREENLDPLITENISSY